MAETDLHKYSVVEKLNKMDVDLINVSIAVDADASGEPGAGIFGLLGG